MTLGDGSRGGRGRGAHTLVVTSPPGLQPTRSGPTKAPAGSPRRTAGWSGSTGTRWRATRCERRTGRAMTGTEGQARKAYEDFAKGKPRIKIGDFTVDADLLYTYQDHVNAELLSDPTLLPRFKGYTDAYNYDAHRRWLHDKIVKDAGIDKMPSPQTPILMKFNHALEKWVADQPLTRRKP